MSRCRLEVGIRMAMGADGSTEVARIVRREFAPVAAGVLVGLAAALDLARLMASFVFGIATTDPATHAVAAGTVLLVGLAAVYLPARRATRMDPVETLRGD